MSLVAMRVTTHWGKSATALVVELNDIETNQLTHPVNGERFQIWKHPLRISGTLEQTKGNVGAYGNMNNNCGDHQPTLGILDWFW